MRQVLRGWVRWLRYGPHALAVDVAVLVLGSAITFALPWEKRSYDCSTPSPGSVWCSIGVIVAAAVGMYWVVAWARSTERGLEGTQLLRRTGLTTSALLSIAIFGAASILAAVDVLLWNGVSCGLLNG
jgi:hypothetical protein